MQSGAGGAPGAVRDGSVSESVAKAPRAGIRGGQKRGISTILFRRFGAIRTFATDLDKRRTRGPLRGQRPRRSPRSRPRAAPGCRNVHFALERTLLTAYLESKMHVSTSAGPTRSHRPGRLASAPPRADPGPRTTTPGEKGSVRRAPSPPRAPTTTHHAKREDRRRHVPHPHPQEAGEDQCARVPPAETRPGPGKPLVLTPPSRAIAPIPACSSLTTTSPATTPAPSPATVSRVSSPTTPTDSTEPSPLPRLRPVPRAVRPGPDGPWDALPRVDDHSQIFRYPRSPVG